MILKRLFFFLAIMLLTFSIKAQNKELGKPIFKGTVSSMVHVPSIASRWTLAPAITEEREVLDGRASGNIVVPGKDPQKEDDYFFRNPNPLTQKISGKAADVVFDAYTSSSMPTDPSLAVGPNHVFVVFNTGFIIYDKNGNALTSELSPNPTIFPDSGCCDLTISYDAAADRWVATFLKYSGGAQIAVSDGPDPINDGWYAYTISSINDYQKLSVWSDGYYITENTSGSNKVWVLEREQMLLGNSSAQILGFNLPGLVTGGFYCPQAFNVSNANMPATGNVPIVYFQDDAWSGVSNDHIKLWLLNVDWVNTANSSISTPQEISITPFISVFDGASFDNLTQPGGSDIDALQGIIMNQAQFRKFADHNSAVFNFVVDADAGSGELAAVRWVELRQSGDGQPWSLYQEGTYTAADGKHAWNASMIMDASGNIGMGYTSMSGPTTSSTVRVSSYYTGRFANDPLNTMTIAEELIANGNADIPGSERYGDYSKMDIDPSDDETFWFINEYMNGQRKGVVGSFKIAPDINNDVGVINIDAPVSGTILTNAEPITISIFNYGSNDASNFNVSYQIDGGTVVTEVYTGTIVSGTSAQYTFTTQADFSTEEQTYSVTASTYLNADEDPSNDSVTQDILHIIHNDIGIDAIVNPVSASYMGIETITATVTNHGGLEQSNIDVAYVLNGDTPVVEQIAGPLAAGASIDYSFSTQGDFSLEQSHNLTVYTSLDIDGNTTNDTKSVVINNFACGVETNSTSQNIGPSAGTVTNSVVNFANAGIINGVTVTININHVFDGDLDIFLIGPDGTEVELSTDNGRTADDYIDTVFSDDATTSIVDGVAPFTGTYHPEGNLSDFQGLSTQGDWTLQITDDADDHGGVLNSWSLKLCVAPNVGFYDNVIDSSDLIVKTLDDNHFNISLTTDEYDKNLTFEVYTILGQRIVYHVIAKDNGNYEYPLDMSYTTPGVYIIKLGNHNFTKLKRIIVE